MAEEEVDEEDELQELQDTQVPQSLKELRACLRCTLVKTFGQFYENGCDNCPFLDMHDSKERVAERTSAFFEGFISMIKPRESWVARWQGIDELKPGVYAIDVVGELPDVVKEYLHGRDIPFRSSASNA